MVNIDYKDKYKLNTILENIDFCENIIKDINEYDFNKDVKTQYALCMSLQIICENTINLSDDIKKEYTNISWNEIKGMRNCISHDYGGLILSGVFNTIKNDLPKLKLNIQEIINDNIKDI